ncbi:MAG: diacylglycerol kinase family lipid kinase [Bacteroidetes bacterium]|nr:diacylglycerol kinase family lipid kinase [Bacteroidota bacterium]
MPKSTHEKWAFIVNPIAGNGSGEAIVPLLKEKIEHYSINAEIVMTERNGHATELSRELLAKGFDYIIAVGGDGTMNEVGAPLVGQENVVTGIVPAGTGNDFNQVLGFPDRFTDSDWEIFFTKTISNLDTGVCNDIPFMNGLGLGFDGVVAAKNYVAPGETKRGGKFKYVWMILSTLFFFKEKMAVIETNGKKEETRCFMNTIAIGRRHAGAFLVTPEAIGNDGLLDGCLIRELNIFQRLKILMMVPKGTHIRDKRVHSYRTKKLTLEFKMEVPFHVDGEVHFANRYEVEIKPDSLRMIYNPHGPHFLNV